MLNVLPDYGHTVGKALALHMDVDTLVFTGSTKIAKQLMVYAGESNMKRIWLEAGGKSPNIVFADAPDLQAAAGIWTSDISKAHKTARAVRAGSVWVNQYDGGDMTAPFGGFKQSGNGLDKSLHALEKYTELKATWVKL